MSALSKPEKNLEWWLTLHVSAVVWRRNEAFDEFQDPAGSLDRLSEFRERIRSLL